MKTLLLCFALVTTLCAEENELYSFRADFNQSITDEHNKTITYRGSLLAKRPSFALWRYEEPIEKELYVYHNVATIIEPELEQAIIKRVNDNIDIFNILHNATVLDANHSEAHYNDQKFLLAFNPDHDLASIAYQDELGHNVTIRFSKQEYNFDCNTTPFKAVIPEGYDIIK